MDTNVDGSCAVALVEEIMLPCQPGQIRICKWSFPYVSFHTPNAEEAAARLLHFSKKQGRWVSVTWRQLQQMVVLEKLQSPADSESGIHQFGDAFVRTGIKELVRSGFVQTRTDAGEESFIPSYKLIRMIKQLQKIQG